MRIQRATRQSSASPVLIPGCLILATVIALFVGVVILLAVGPRLPGIALQAAGFSPRGITDEIFQRAGPANPPSVDNATSVSDAAISLGQRGQHVLNMGSGYSLSKGTVKAIPGAVFSITEGGLMTLCAQFYESCSTSADRFRNARVDFRSGGAIIYGEAYVRELGLWQSVGLVLEVGESGRQLQVSGLDVQGSLYQAPAGTMTDLIGQIESEANTLLNHLTIEIDGQYYRLDRLQIDDTELSVILR